MQLLQLDMLVELDRVCRKHNIMYCISCGTLLGAVRHGGYIPWDDDADIVMLREEYEKFKLVADELNPRICWLQDHFIDPGYLWQYSKLRRTGTSFVRAGQEHMKGETGVFIDIFVLDDIPRNGIAMMIQDFWCFFLRKVLWSRVGKINEKGITKYIYSVMSHISVDWVYKQVGRISDKSRNGTPNRVRALLFPSFGKLYLKNKHSVKERYGMPKSWFTERSEYEFEGHKLYGTKDYDAFLKYMYDDYMTLPPEEKRQPHAPVSSFNFDVGNTSETE
nr:LicD family protein [Kineothrix sp. MSJ-39]